jgi:transposase
MHLRVRKFFCDREHCARKVFCERLGVSISAYARRTQRLIEQMRHVAFIVGARPGTRLLPKLGLSASFATLLRWMRETPFSQPPAPRVIGVDDWAFRKRHRYGAIIIDLERRCPIDLLPNRSGATLAAWLHRHPSIEIVARDRDAEFAEAISKAAPQAIQVADRFHLLCNLYAALMRLMDRQPSSLRAAARQVAQVESELSHSSGHGELSQRAASSKQSVRQALFAEVKDLQKKGWKRNQIARRLKIDRRTVSRYFQYDQYPGRAGDAGPVSSVQPFMDYVFRRWQQEGCRNRKQIHHELKAMGYRGSYSSVLRAVNRALSDGELTHPGRRGKPKVGTRSAAQAAWILMRKPDALRPDDLEWLAALCEGSPMAAKAHQLAQAFGQMVREQRVGELNLWLRAASESGIHQFRAFAKSLERDYEAVRAALILPWSNGQVEGQVRRLKLIKRKMYGRANVDLLRLKVLYRA